MKEILLSELSEIVDGELAGPKDPFINGLADLSNARKGNISFWDGKSARDVVESTKASALIVPDKIPGVALPQIIVKDPYLAAAIIHNHFLNKDFVPSGVGSGVTLGVECQIPHDVSIAPQVFIGDRVSIGHRVSIGAGTVIGNDSVIGDDCFIHPNVSILERSILGERVIIHSGTVIGSDGFGYATDSKGNHVKRPHVGYVQIDDDVELGACVCVDRGTFGRTWIRKGTKVDNLVQIAHNVEIGENSIMVSQSGLAGSVVLGNHVVMGGKAAVSGHLKIGDRVTMAAKAGVISDLEDDAVVAGFPAIPHKNWLRASAIFSKLPELAKEIRELKNKVTDLFEKIGDKK